MRFLDRRQYVEFEIEARSLNRLHQAQVLRGFDVAIMGWSELDGHRDTAEILVKRSWLSGVSSVTVQILDVQGNHFMHRMAFRLPRVPTDVVRNKENIEDIRKNPDDTPPVPEDDETLVDLAVSSQHKIVMMWAQLKTR